MKVLTVFAAVVLVDCLASPLTLCKDCILNTERARSLDTRATEGDNVAKTGAESDVKTTLSPNPGSDDESLSAPSGHIVKRYDMAPYYLASEMDTAGMDAGSRRKLKAARVKHEYTYMSQSGISDPNDEENLALLTLPSSKRI